VRWRTAVTLLTVLLFTGCQPLESSYEEEGDEVIKAEHYSEDSVSGLINAFIEREEIPGMSVLVFRDDKVLAGGCFGYADVQKGIKLTEEHIFLIASVSKTITATALMELYDKGILGLDDPINEYLPFDVVNPYYDGDITFRMLLNHTSSIADGEALDDQYYYMEDSPVPLEEFMCDYLEKGGRYYDEDQNYYDFAPGDVHEYSNVGSALIGVLVESISGQCFDEYCKEHIFDPLEMTHSYWMLEDAPVEMIVTPYDDRLEPLRHYTFTDYPNGGLRTNASDLMNFAGMYLKKGIYGSEKVLKESTVDLMLSRSVPELEWDVGLHFFQMEKEENIWYHDGGEEGVSTFLALDRDRGTGVIVLCNKSDVELEELVSELLRY